MMTHRQLVEKYANQLNEARARAETADKRIIELETAVADCEDRILQQDSSAREAKEVFLALESQHGVVRTKVDELERALSKKLEEFNALKVQAENGRSSDQSTIQQLRGQLATVSNSPAGQMARISHPLTETADVGRRNAQLVDENTELRGKIREVSDAIAGYTTRLKAVDSEAQALRVENAGLKEQVTKLNKAQDMSEAEHLAHLQELKHKKFGKKQFKDELSALNTQLSKTKNSLDLERKRR